MKKYIIGAVSGAALMFGGYAFAYSTAFSLVDSYQMPYDNYIDKVYDKDSNVVCYVVHDGSQGADGVSCLKNN